MKTETPSRSTASLLAAKREHFLPGVHHFYRNPPVLVRGEMQYLYDADGRRYLDGFSGVGVVSAGHCNPAVSAAICEQVRQLQHVCTIHLTEPAIRLAERLAGLTGGALPRVFFCNSGSEAVDGAMVMARQATGRRKIMALENSLHGRTHATSSLTGLPMWRTDSWPLTDVVRVPSFIQEGSLQGIETILRKLDTPPAAFVVEPIQGNGGIHTPPDGWFGSLRSLCDLHGMLLIADEVQTGMNRTGRMFALDHWGVRPDLCVLAKALGNGQPIAAILATEAVGMAQVRPTASTFGGNPVSCVAALAALDYHAEHDLAGRANRLGAVLRRRLESLRQEFPCISDVRGAGLMLGAELTASTPEEAAHLTDMVLESMKDNGCLIGKTGSGRNVLTFMPPLIIDQGDIDSMIAILSGALRAAIASSSAPR